MAKRVFYKDEWGEIIEYKRYRSTKTGRLLKDNTRSRFKRVETVQYRYVDGRRFGEPVEKLTRGEVIKTTAPGRFADNEGGIWESLRDTNVFTQVHKAESAFVNIRGRLPNGELFRHQFPVTFGEKNQAEQLTLSIYWELASYNLRTNYNIEHVRFKYTSPRDARRRQPLTDLQISVTLNK